ncbi:hypothetical protein K438DRAFT_235221 [Mycena galopus ATCC 62051]|nr:hypothetical protein K438DRAFT_235221 [Mycena galopus ATCC 62051]
MHPSLKLSNLSRLPPFLKRRATAAASGSAEEALALAIGLADIAPSNLLLLLPVFYALLDATQIPGIFNHLDSSSTRIQDDIRVRIAQILFHLRAIAQIETRVTIPLAVFMDLWIHIGPWIEFLDEYRDHLPGLDVLSPVTRYSMFLSLLRFMRRDGRVSHLINTSVALCVVVGRAWHHLIHANETNLENVSHFLASLFEASPRDVPAFEGLVAGAGGTCVDLALLVVSHLNRVVPSPDSIITEQHALLFCGVEHLVVRANGSEDAGPVWGTAFRDALLSHGIIPTLMTASRVLSQPTTKLHIAEKRLKGFLTHAIDFMCSFPCSKWIRVALRAGLLPAIFACGTAHHIEATRDLLVVLLQYVLPTSMVYHSVLSQLRISLVEVRDQDAAATFADAEVLELWTRFREMLQCRLEVLDGYNTGSLPATMVCDNLECAKVCHKHELRRCGGCTVTYYCSRHCQSNDWCGEHRQMCAALSSRRHRRFTAPEKLALILNSQSGLISTQGTSPFCALFFSTIT